VGAGAGWRSGTHSASRCAGQEVTHAQARTVTREYVTTTKPYTTTVTRNATVVPMRRQRSEEIGYGSSYPNRRIVTRDAYSVPMTRRQSDDLGLGYGSTYPDRLR